MNFDLDMFKIINNNACLMKEQVEEEEEKDMISKCQRLMRICIALKYYNLLLNEKNVINGKNIFIEFCSESYEKECLNDYVHTISNHNKILNNEIFQELQVKYGLNKCEDLNKCKCTQRHFRNREISNNEYNFYIEIFDNLHFHINHLHTLGLRFDGLNDENNDDNKNNYSNCYDSKFDQIKQEIQAKREKYGLQNMKRLETDDYNSSKFNISVFQNQKDDTFMDSMYIYLNNINNKMLPTLHTFMVSQEFDSECIFEDVSNGVNEKSNLLFAVEKDIESVENIIAFIRQYKVKNSSFSTGVVFLYWKWFENEKNQKRFMEKQLIENQNDFGGHLLCDLVVSSHFDSIACEVLESNLIDVSGFKQLVVEKAKKYLKTEKCKKIKCIEQRDKLHFSIGNGARLREEHVQSLLLYTDFTTFCTHFSATFRCAFFGEDIKSIKERNSKFYYISKYLREVIQYYGISNSEYRDRNGKECGPFYCGMSVQLSLEEFAIRLNAPSSTSKHIEVAMRFAGPKGIIIQLNNKTFTGRYESFFDSSWISSFPEENERIMMGGRWKLEIESVRVMKTKNNYEIFLKSYFLFDKMISGQLEFEGKISSQNIFILEKSVDNFLNIEKSPFDSYINDCFYLFCHKKNQIILNLEQIEQIEQKQLTNIIMNQMKEYDVRYGEYSVLSNNTNMFKSVLFSLFPNGNQITIYATSDTGMTIYPFCLSYFFNNVILDAPSSFKNITIKAVRYEDTNDTWICSQVNKKFKKICQKEKVNVTLKREQRAGGRFQEDWLIFSL